MSIQYGGGCPSCQSPLLQGTMVLSSVSPGPAFDFCPWCGYAYALLDEEVLEPPIIQTHVLRVMGCSGIDELRRACEVLDVVRARPFTAAPIPLSPGRHCVPVPWTSADELWREREKTADFLDPDRPGALRRREARAEARRLRERIRNTTERLSPGIFD